MWIKRKVAYGANPEAVPVAKFALKPLVAFASRSILRGDGLELDRLVMRRTAPPTAAPPSRLAQAQKMRSRPEPRHWIFVV